MMGVMGWMHAGRDNHLVLFIIIIYFIIILQISSTNNIYNLKLPNFNSDLHSIVTSPGMWTLDFFY